MTAPTNREIRVGDCRALLRELPDESVNCVVTSPPYWGLRDYGVDGQIGLESSPEVYVAGMVEVFREVRRVLRADGVAWVNLGDSYATGAYASGEHPGGGYQGARFVDINRLRDNKLGYRGERLANGRGDNPAILRKKTRATRDGSHAGKHTAMAANGPMTQPNRMPIPGLKPKDMVGIPWRVAFALQADGWWLRADVIWSKANPMPESVRDRPTKAHEYLFLLTKSEQYFYDADAIREPQVAPEASTPGDVARAFSRRRATTADPRQEALGAPRRRSGNKTRSQRIDAGGAKGRNTNQSFGIPWEDTDGLRNKRSVWTIATEPYGGAHFATFPRKLVEPCILAGCPKSTCLACGMVLDFILDNVARTNTNGYDLRSLQKELSKAAVKGRAHEVLQSDLRRAGDDDGQADSAVRVVPGADDDGQAGSAAPLLRSGVRERSHGGEPRDDEGSLHLNEGLRSDPDAGAPERGERLCDGAPARDGEAAGAAPAAVGNRPPQGRKPRKQRGRQSREDAEASARPSAEGANGQSHVPALQVHAVALAPCPRCSADLTTPGAVGPGLVLDPFGGSGTVGEVAEALGRRWMLLELNPAYAELARARTAQRGLFGDAAAAALAAGGAS